MTPIWSAADMPVAQLDIGRSQFKVSDFLGWQRDSGLELRSQLPTARSVEDGSKIAPHR